MPSVIHRFDPPDRFVAGTVGPPGQRAFYLQARTGIRVITVALEKPQVAALAERIAELLDEVMQSGGTREVVPAITPRELEDSAPLDTPIEEQFRGGTMTLSWDADDERLTLEVFPFTEAAVVTPDQPEEEIVEPEPDEVFLVRLPAAAARAFAERTQKVLQAGRPECPFCGRPVDPEGHLCVRANGFKRRVS